MSCASRYKATQTTTYIYTDFILAQPGENTQLVFTVAYTHSRTLWDILADQWGADSGALYLITNTR